MAEFGAAGGAFATEARVGGEKVERRARLAEKAGDPPGQPDFDSGPSHPPLMQEQRVTSGTLASPRPPRLVTVFASLPLVWRAEFVRR